LRKSPFDVVVSHAQCVVFGVGYRRRIVLIVTLVVPGDFARQARELLRRFRVGQLADRLVLETAHARARFLATGRGGSASVNSRFAAARASSVTIAPESVRAISSILSPSSSSATRVASPNRVMRKWRDARAATWGECVTRSTWVLRARRCNLSPTAAATAPPTPRSTSSKTRTAGGLASARATFKASA